ncbi:MAG: MFS transporter [Calditrichaeota bacterium]|nr:MAG: MFS transporter [Calditrichota bacterium]
MTSRCKELAEIKKPKGFIESVRFEFRDYLTNIKLFSQNARLYLLGSFLIGVNFHVFQLLLNLYLRELGFEESQIGYVISSRAVGMTLIAIPGAMLLSRIRLKPILLASVSLFALFMFFISSFTQLEFLIGFSALAGMSFAFYRIGAGPFYMRNSTERERTHLFSVSFGMMIMAGMAGSFGSGQLVTIFADHYNDIILGYRYTLYIGIIFSLIALIPFFFIKASRPSDDENKINLSLEQFRLRGKFYFRITISNFMVGLGAGLIIPFLNLYFRDRFHLGADTIGLYYFFVSFAMLAGSLAGPVVAHKFGLVRAVVITQLISIPFMFILSYSYVLPLVVTAFILRAGFMNLGVPIVTNLGMELSEKKEQGLVNALLMVSWTSSWMISAAAGGTLIDKYGYTFTINITIALYLLSTILFYSFFKNAEEKTDSHPKWIISKENNT